MGTELTLRPYQKECINIIDNMKKGSGLVALPVGTGKCLAKGTEVLMKSGLLEKVENLMPGDVILGPDGIGRIIVSTTSGREKMARILLKDNESYTVNMSHILSLLFIADETVESLTVEGMHYHSGDVVNIGVKTLLSLSKKERSHLYGYKVPAEFKQKPQEYDPYTKGKEIAGNMETLPHRGISRIYLTDCLERRKRLFAGIVDKIGIPHEKGIMLQVRSRELRDDLRFLIGSIGLHAQTERKKKGYDIIVSGILSRLPTRRKFDVEDDAKALISPISVKQLKEDEYYGFEIQGTDRLFMLGNFYVTHNTVIFSHIKRPGRTLILSHREELVHQPEKYYDCSYGVERADEHSNGEDVISASVQTLHRRLDKFSPDEFDTIITDEAHHAVAPTYQKIYDYFKPRLHIGFTATPNRKDKIGLGKIYDEILFERTLKWGIEKGYLCNINCQRIELDFDLAKVKKSMGDFQEGSLASAMDFEKNNVGIAKAYKEMAVGQTVVFAVNVAHTHHLTKEINKICGRKEAVAITATTVDRASILEDFRQGKIKCLVNCMVLTEGTDLPMIETIIMARPTQNESLLMQCIGRGTRTYPGKKELLYIDCVGTAENLKVCGPASLLGMDESAIPAEKKKNLTGSILEIQETLEEMTEEAKTKPEQWRLTTYSIDLFSDDLDLNTRNLNFSMTPDGGLSCPTGRDAPRLYITPMDYLGKSSVYCYEKNRITKTIKKKVPLQEAIDSARQYLEKKHVDGRNIWDMERVVRWGKLPATDKQIEYLRYLLSYPTNKGKYKDINIRNLTKYEASQIIADLASAIKPIFSRR